MLWCRLPRVSHDSRTSAGLLTGRLARADALRRRWKPHGDVLSEQDLRAGERDWTQQDIVEAWRRFAGGGVPDWARERTSLYLHALLCPTKCSYCHCTARQPQHRRERDDVFQRLMNDIATFAPAVEGLTFRDLYFGGGTPSIFHEGQLEALFDGLFSGFRIAEGEERAIEMNPANATPAKLRLARQAGFNRVSFGIESLTPEVLIAHNRGYQRPNKVARAVEAALKTGFPHVNVDLLVLPGETVPTFRNVVQQVVSMQPTEIHLYKLQRQPTYAGGEDTLTFRDAHAVLAELSAAAGYGDIGRYEPHRVSARAGLRRPPAEVPLVRRYRHQTVDLGSTLGLGPGADSMCRFQVRYTERAIGGDATRPRYRGSRRGGNDELRGFLLQQLMTARREGLSLEDLRKLFGHHALDTAAPVLDELETVGWITRDDTQLFWALDAGWQAVTAGLALASDAEWAQLEEQVTRFTPSGVPVPEGAVAGTEWRVGGMDGRFPGWRQLCHAAHAPVLFRVEEDDPQERVLARAGGYQVRYRGDAPRSAAKALEMLLEQVAASS